MFGAPTPEQICLCIGGDYADREYLLDPRDVWVANPHYEGPPGPHPEDDDPDMAYWDARAVAYDAEKEGKPGWELTVRRIMAPWDRADSLELAVADSSDDLPF